MFKEMENTQAYLKAGLLGFAGSGKSTTATNIAGGLVLHMREKQLEMANKPVFFLDTECGADWIKPLLEKQDIKLKVWKTRAFKDLIDAVDMAEKEASVLIIDSITHFWVELTETYQKQKNRKNGLQFQDWAFLKAEWRRFTDKYINSNLHIIMCGRAGYEYDYFENEGGKKELEKTGIKMKAENETGYEASLLVLMERHQELDKDTISKQYRTATILKDRSREIDGKIFTNPKFKDFLPHINFLNLGGLQMGIDTSRNSEDLITKPEKNTFYNDQQKKVALDEIDAILTKHFPGSSAADKKAKGDLLEKYAQTRSWERLETLGYDKIRSVRDMLWIELEKITYNQSFENSGETQRMIEVFNFLLNKMHTSMNIENLEKFKSEYSKLFDNIKIIAEEDYNKLMTIYTAREEELRKEGGNKTEVDENINFINAG